LYSTNEKTEKAGICKLPSVYIKIGQGNYMFPPLQSHKERKWSCHLRKIKIQMLNFDFLNSLSSKTRLSELGDSKNIALLALDRNNMLMWIPYNKLTKRILLLKFYNIFEKLKIGKTPLIHADLTSLDLILIDHSCTYLTIFSKSVPFHVG